MIIQLHELQRCARHLNTDVPVEAIKLALQSVVYKHRADLSAASTVLSTRTKTLICTSRASSRTLL